jgi:geranylgeranyl reductase family protein
MRRKFDVIIVGAGPAGCSAAIFLAKAGYEVLLLDRASFPRDKVCGDGISPPALDLLERMGLNKVMGSRKPWRVDGIDVISPTGKTVRAEFRSVEEIRDYGYVWPRRDFDLMLLDSVRETSNVHILEDCEFTDLDVEGNRFSGIKALLRGESRVFKGDVVIGADGAHSRIRGKIACSNMKSRHIALAVRTYFNGVGKLGHYIEIHCERSILPGYGWVFPTGEGSANVGLGTSYRSARVNDLRRLFSEFLRQAPSMRERFNKATIVGHALSGWPIPLGFPVPKCGIKNVLLVGDAGGFADPLTGEGIYQALRSGELAAQSVRVGLESRNDADGIGDVYKRLCGREFRVREYIMGYLIQKYFLNRFFLDFNVSRAGKKPKMASTLAAILCHRRSKLRLLF